jgi:hypothetical protein
MSDYERIARAFHGVYETLAPEHGYESRPESRVPWAEVPEKNRALMIGTVRRLVETGVISADPITTMESTKAEWRKRWEDELLSDEAEVAAQAAAQDVNWHVRRDQLADHPTGHPGNRDVVRAALRAALASINQKGGSDV